jgi:hypothetical protein
MRFLMQITVPTPKGNEVVQDGSLQQAIQQFAEQWQPEAMYFVLDDGKRCAFIVFDLADLSAIPSIAEPFFGRLEAEIRLSPAMNADDLSRGLSQLGR